MPLLNDSTVAGRSSASGESAFLKGGCRGWKRASARGVPELFPPELVVQVKALACELPSRCGAKLSRWSTADLAREVCRTGLVATVSEITVWRWLHQDAIRPWQHRCWIFTRDSQFAIKASRILDLYHRNGQVRVLREYEFVVSAVEKTSIQARSR